MKETSRLQNTFRNASVAMAGQIIYQLLHFISRIVFIKTLGVEYMGASGLFSDILSMLSVAELGIGSAIVYAMYKPMAEQDEKKLGQLTEFYRFAYMRIGLLILAAGLLITPFLRVFIRSEDIGAVTHLEWIYILVLLNSVVTYFFSYKITLLTVAQKAYIESLSSTCFRILQVLGQIVVLFVTQNYILYLIVQLLCTIGHNVVVSSIAKKRFPILQNRITEKLPEEDRKNLFKNVRALVLHRLGSFFVNGTDSIIISKFLGLAINGMYSNYRSLVITVQTFPNILFNSMVASIGNLNATESKEKTRIMFERIHFMGYWIAAFCSVCFLCLLTPFITICYGEALKLNTLDVVFIVANFYVGMMRQPVLSFRNALGLYWYDRYKPLIESVVNIVASLVLLHYMGLAGVLAGTVISSLSVVLWIEPKVLYHYGLEADFREYLVRYVKQAVLCAVICGMTVCLTQFTRNGTIDGFIINLLICLLFPNVILWLVYRKRSEFAYFKQIVGDILNRMLQKVRLYGK